MPADGLARLNDVSCQGKSPAGRGFASACCAGCGIFRDTLWNQKIPDELRGRMAGVELLSYSVGPSAGQIRAGLGARVTSVRVSLWSGGLACVAAAGLICLALPRFAAYHAAAAGEAHPRAGETTESRTEAAQGAPPGKPVPAAGNPG